MMKFIEKIMTKQVELEDALIEIAHQFGESGLEEFLGSFVTEVIKDDDVQYDCLREVRYIAADIANGDDINAIRPLLGFISNHTKEEEEKASKALQALTLIFNNNPSNEFRDLVKEVGPDFIISYHLDANGFLHRVAQKGASTEFLEILKDLEANFTVTNLEGNSALLAAIANAENNFAQRFVQFSAENKLDIAINSADTIYGQNTALHLAVAKGYINRDSHNNKLTISNAALTECLIDHGADPNIQNKYGFSPLDLAVMKKDCDVTSILCSSPLLREDTVASARKYVGMGYEEVKENLSTTTNDLFLSPNKRNFNESIKSALEAILDGAIEHPNVSLDPKSFRNLQKEKESCLPQCTIM